MEREMAIHSSAPAWKIPWMEGSKRVGHDWATSLSLKKEKRKKKVFTEFVKILLLFYVLVSWPRGMWDHSSLTRDGIHTPGTGRQCHTSGPPGKSHLDSSLSVTSYLLSILRKSPSAPHFICSVRVTSSTYITGMLQRPKGVVRVHAQPLPGTSKCHMRVHKALLVYSI